MERSSSARPHFFIGTSGWTYDHWKGSFYPESLPKSHWFDYYASHFSSVEINATFYRTFKDQTYQKWKERSPQEFGYVLKAPRLITHRKFLLDVDELVKVFYQSCTLLEDKFELILLQVAPQTPYDPERLSKALLAFPDPGKVAVEFRHPEWYSQETLDMLQSIGTTICNVDSPRQKITSLLTSNKAYLRLHGRKHWYSYNYSEDELKEIAGLATELVHRGATRMYIFFNNDFEGYAPANALALKHLLP
ncbi:MAG TPA: DUF72 domain-containing protein [Anaerolineales bacterium]|nr:DUF72 domain-containing protein [Anaerolineales bacterium]